MMNDKSSKILNTEDVVVEAIDFFQNIDDYLGAAEAGENLLIARGGDQYAY